MTAKAKTLTLSCEQRVRLECYECSFESVTIIGPNLPIAEWHIQWFGHGHFRFTRSTCWKNPEKILLNQTCNTEMRNQTCNTEMRKCNVFIT
jgi:hypothetical protein